MREFILGMMVFLSCQARAEYRAFELVITDAASGKERVVLSTLDPNQFRRYYPVALTEKVTYRSTWRCRGNTSGFKPICPRPEGKN